MLAVKEANERLVCAILAEQVSALRDRMDTKAAFDLLWRTGALLSWLSGLLGEVYRVSTCRRARCSNASARKPSLKLPKFAAALDDLAFVQAQRQDFARQIADCVVTALERMAVAEMPEGTSFSSSDLAQLYVSEDQRKLHEAVIRRMSP